MQVNSPELNAIWLRIDMNMTDDDLHKELIEAGYSSHLHQRFTGLAHGELLGGPEQLKAILRPIRTFYERRVEKANESIKDITDKDKRLADRIRPLFADVINPSLEAEHQKNSSDVSFHANTMAGYKDVINLIEFVLADPRLQQKNPALSGHNLDY